jgi:hypothetical protein
MKVDKAAKAASQSAKIKLQWRHNYGMRIARLVNQTLHKGRGKRGGKRHAPNLYHADADVARAIADQFFQHDTATVGHRRLAELTGLTTRTIGRSIPRLEKAGHIVTRDEGGFYGHRKARYAIVFDPADFGKSVPTGVTGPTASDSLEDIHMSSNGGHPYVLQPEDIHMSSDPSTSRALARGGEDPPGAAAPTARRAGGEASTAFEKVWRVWPLKAAGSRGIAKRVFEEVMARPDAPSIEALEAGARAYAANVPRPRWRWLHKWLEGEGWLEDPQPSSPRADDAKPKRERRKKLNGKAKPEAGGWEWHDNDGGYFYRKTMGCTILLDQLNNSKGRWNVHVRHLACKKVRDEKVATLEEAKDLALEIAAELGAES